MNITATAERAHLLPSYVDGPREELARDLKSEMIEAMLAGNVGAKLPVPQWRDAYQARCTTAPVHEIVWDELDGDDEAFHDVLQIVALAAAGAMTPELHLRASAWIAKRAAFYAKTHGGSL